MGRAIGYLVTVALGMAIAGLLATTVADAVSSAMIQSPLANVVQ